MPQAYLTRWTVDGTMHVWDKEKRAGFSTSPRHVAFRKDFHAEQGAAPDRFERAFTERFERPQMISLSALLAEIQAGAALSAKRRADLDRVLITQLLRLPRMRQRLEQLFSALGYRVNPALEARRYHLDVLDGRSSLQDLYLDVIRPMGVTLLLAPDSAAFWTSDAPVLQGLAHPVHGGMRMSWMTDLTDPAALLLMPLSPRVAAHYGPAGSVPATPDGRSTLSVEGVRRVNDLTFVNAERQVFSVTPLHPAEPLLTAEASFRAQDRAAREQAPKVTSEQRRQAFRWSKTFTRQ